MAVIKEIRTTLTLPDKPAPQMGCTLANVVIGDRPATVKILLSGRALHIITGFRSPDGTTAEWHIDLETLLADAGREIAAHHLDGEGVTCRSSI